VSQAQYFKRTGKQLLLGILTNRVLGGGSLSKGKMKMMTCPGCGWMVKSPWGENDIVEHVMLHAKNHHPEMKNMKKEDLVKMIKDA
jgi:predicted small metal-binding protein